MCLFCFAVLTFFVILCCCFKLLITQSWKKSPNKASGLDLLAEVQHFCPSKPKSSPPQQQLPLPLLLLLLPPWAGMREGDRKDGLVGALAVKRRIIRKWRLHVSLRDGAEFRLSRLTVNLRDPCTPAMFEAPSRCGPSAGLLLLAWYSSSKDGSPWPALFLRTWWRRDERSWEGTRKGDGKEGLIWALAVKRRMTRKWRLHVNPQDGCDLGLSWLSANLQDRRISASTEAAILREVDGSWCSCDEFWSTTSFWSAWQWQSDVHSAPVKVDPPPSGRLPGVDPPPWALCCCQAGPLPWAQCHHPFPAAAPANWYPTGSQGRLTH